MLKDYLKINDILINLENILQVNYMSKRVTDIVEDTITNLERVYGIEFNKSIFQIQEDTIGITDNVSGLVRQLNEALKNIAMLTCLEMTTSNYTVSVKSCDYLGFGKTHLLGALKWLQREDLYPQGRDYLTSLKLKADRMEMSEIKKLIILMCIFDRIGMSEGVELIAEYLYIGGV